MAMQVKELARCAGIALTRQLQVISRLRPSQHKPPLSMQQHILLPPARGVSHSSSLGGGASKGQGARRGGSGLNEGTATKKPVEEEKVQVKLATQEKVLAYRRFLPEYARPMAIKAARGPLVKGRTNSRYKSQGRPPLLAEIVDKKAGLSRSSNKVRFQPVPSGTKNVGRTQRGSKTDNGKLALSSAQPRETKKNVMTSRSQNITAAAASEQKNESLREPISKLAKDINQWFNEVLEHLAKAEGNAIKPAGKSNKSVPAKSSHIKLTRKSTATKTERPRSTGLANSSVVSTTDAQHLAPSWTKSTLKPENGRAVSWKPKIAAAWGTDDPLGSNKVNKNPDLQLSAWHAKTDRAHEKNNTRKAAGLTGTASPKKVGLSEGTSTLPDRTGTPKPMLEITPSVVGKAESLSPLVSAAAWWPYGAPHDTLTMTSADHGDYTGHQHDARADLDLSYTTSGTAAIFASNILPETTKHQVEKGSSKTILTNSTSSTKASLEKGKGFILLSNKDKAQEAEENRLKSSHGKSDSLFVPGDKTVSSSFILLDNLDQTAVANTLTTVRRNKVLSDNPHKAREQNASFKIQTNMETHENKIKEKRNGDNSLQKQPSKQTQYLFEAGPKPKTKDVKDEKDFETNDQYARRWVEKVEKKLSELQASKQASITPPKKSRKSHDLEDVNRKPLADAQSLPNTKKQQEKEKMYQLYDVSPISAKEVFKVSTRNVANKSQKTAEANEHKNKTSVKSDGENNLRIKTKEDSIASMFPAYGPLTYEQQTQLDKIIRAVDALYKADNKTTESNASKVDLNHGLVTHSYLKRKPNSGPVAVEELKPDLASLAKSEGVVNKNGKQKTEPTLYVTPEELKGAKDTKLLKSTSSAVLSNSTFPDKTLTTEPAYSEYDVWSAMVQEGLDKNKGVSKSKLTRIKANSPEVSQSDGIKNVAQHKKPGLGAPKVSQDSEKPLLKGSQQSDTSSRYSRNPSVVDNTQEKSSAQLTANSAIKFFEHQYVKDQHSKLLRSQKLKTERKNTNQVDTEKKKRNSSAVRVDKTASESDGISIKTKSPTQGPKVQKDSDEKVLEDSKRASTERKLFTGVKKSMSSDKTLDPFERWLQRMEDLKSNRSEKSSTQVPPKKSVGKKVGKKSQRQPENVLKHKSVSNTSVGKPTNKNQRGNDTQKKQYSRFETQPLGDVSQTIHRDIYNTHSNSGLGNHRQGCEAEMKKPTAASTAKELGNQLPTSDQLYNQIRESTRSPQTTLPLGSTFHRQRSKVLTQSGLGTVTDSRTGLVDPSRLPKLGNLFSTFDGFLAMDAVPVLDEPVVAAAKGQGTENKQPDTGKGAAHGDGVKGDDVRQSLAREREMASAAARRRMIENYEKNIEMYEKGLEIYRGKLRHARLAMEEPGTSKPRSDNPRRHDL